MVAEPLRRVCLAAVTIGLLLSGASACSSFDPVKERRFKLLTEENYEALGIVGTHWKAYDDQHSFRSACTNGAAGDHAPKECSTLVEPYFAWDGRKCPPTGNELAQVHEGGPVIPKPDGSICLIGLAAELLPCKELSDDRCRDTTSDSSNIWGAGIALEITAEVNKAWDAPLNGVTGVAFDLSYLPESDDLNLRIEIPISLNAAETAIPTNRPTMMEDGAVIGKTKTPQLYRGNCDSDHPSQSDWPGTHPTKLRELLVASSGESEVSSEQHPFGSSFWQLRKNSVDSKDPHWGPSPVVIGHNEFKWGDVFPPPEPMDNYSFTEQKILGIQFHVVPPNDHPRPLSFSFCIKNLAFLLDE